tara:strand:- start:6 stop:653 length:648 start_codon:yes stop_codon:yes gene_type:complete
MDGNGRWGKKRGKTRKFGHLNGVKVIEKIVKHSIKLRIPILTFYTFSTENWKRPKAEINFLFKLIDSYFFKEINNLVKNNIKINIIGNTKRLPKKIKQRLKESIKRTRNCRKILVNLALNYGSKDEIINSVRSMKEKKEKISITNFEKNLYTKAMPNPDFLIRTGGKKRLSNFLLWQLAYSELYFIEKLWPDFTITDFNKIVKNFKRVKRNFGKI